MSTLFVERSGACVGGESLISEEALVKVSAALPEADRARLHWVVGYVGNRLLARDEIRDMSTWMDLFGHAREVGIDMTQIRSFIDSARGERFLQKHEVRSLSADADAPERESAFLASHRARNASPQAKNGRKKAPLIAKKNGHPRPAAAAKTRADGSVRVGSVVKDLDARRRRSGHIIEVGDGKVKIKWETGRINEISLERLRMPRLFAIS